MLKHFSETLFEKYRDDSDPMWHQTSASYCTALAEILCKYFEIEDVTIDNIYNLHLQGEERVISESHVFGPPVPTYFKAFFSDKKVENAYKLIYPTLCAPNETKSSIHCVFTSCLSSLVLNSAIKDMMSRSSFDVIDIVKEPTAVFIFTRETRSVYSPLITACIDQFYDVLLEYADSHGGCLERRVKFIIDEFANLTKINKFETKISASRSRNILWMLVCQSLEQISLVYGNDVASIILGNSNDIVYLHSPDLNLINKISAMCGERVDEYTGQKEPLCPMELLRHFDKQSGEALFLIERLHPFITHLPDISKYYGVKPVDELNIRKRSNVYRQPIDFQKFVDEGSSKTRKQRRS